MSSIPENNTTKDFENELLHAIGNNDIFYVMDLVHLYKIDVNIKEGYPLILACTFDYFDIVEFLLENGADPNAQDGDALCNSSRNGHLESIKLLIKYNIDLKQYGEDALIGAAFYGHTNIVRFLLEKGCTVQNLDEVLITAALNKELDLVVLLLKNGATIYSLHNKVYQNNEYSTYGTLLDFGYIEIKYQDRYTLFDLLLNYANHKKHIELVDILNNQM